MRAHQVLLKTKKAMESTLCLSFPTTRKRSANRSQLPLLKAANLLTLHSLLLEARLPAPRTPDLALEMLVGPKQIEPRQNTRSSPVSHIVAGGRDYPET